MLQNVRIKCIFAQLNIFLWKMYALQKCIFASNAFCRFLTFWFALRCKNAFLHQMHFCITFSFGKCTQKCIFASNAFDAKMHFCNAPTKCKGSIKCICNILCYKMYASNAFVTFCVTKCTHQMHFGNAKQNVRIKCI